MGGAGSNSGDAGEISGQQLRIFSQTDENGISVPEGYSLAEKNNCKATKCRFLKERF
jgi:hypothetical protein